MKKLLSFAIASALALSLVGCGDSGSTSKDQGTTGGNVSTQSGGEVAGLSGAIAEQPILLTSAGQSADYQMVGTVLNKLGFDYETNNVATSADLDGVKTLLVAVGGSSKGLGAAGIDADGELARMSELLDAAQSAGLTIITMHTGGAARRGDLSDKFIAPAFEYADYAIIVSSGDEDGMMKGICANKAIPVDFIEGIGDLTSVLPAAFK